MLVLYIVFVLSTVSVVCVGADSVKGLWLLSQHVNKEMKKEKKELLLPLIHYFDFCCYYYFYHHHNYSDVTNCLVVVLCVCFFLSFTHDYFVIGPLAVELACKYIRIELLSLLLLLENIQRKFENLCYNRFI
jgi:hypothetical protein